MDVESKSPSFNTRSRKRIRERDRSPDMFAEEDETNDEKITIEGTKDSGIVINNNISSEVITSPVKKNPVKTPVKSLKSQFIKMSPLSSASKLYSQTSVSSSLRSTLNPTHPNLGINGRLKKVSELNNTRFDLSSHPTSSTVNTPAVYTLHNRGAEVEQSIYAGPNYGLSDLVWTEIQQCKGISNLYDWQDQCLTKAVESSQNLIYSLPTSGGKTLVAEILMIRELLCNRKHSIYVLPYVSIVQEKIRTLSTLAVNLNFAVEEYAGNRGAFPPRQRRSKKVIYIATLEKAHGIINSLMELGRLQEIGLVVVDEIHIIGDGRRGAILETLLCKLLLAPISPRIVAMSATIGNISELSYFLKADVYTQDFRPVKLKEYIKTGDTLLEVNSSKFRRPEDLMIPARSLPALSAATRKIDPDGIGALVAEIAPQHCSLVFCPTKKNCESVAQLVSRTLPPTVLEWKSIEKRKLRQALQSESGQLCPVLKTTLPYGVAYHHSGLTADERQLIEEAFSAGILCCLCCTSTLAAGVNLPARRVVLRSPFMGTSRLTRARYQQMVGRAGRAGFDTHGESVLIVKPSELSFVTNDILLAPTDRVESQLAEDNLHGLQNLFLSLVSLDLGGKDRLRLAETLMLSTLLGQQLNSGNCPKVTTTAIDLVDKSLQHMKDKKLVDVTPDGQVSVTKLGRATLKGVVDLDRSSQLFQDLRQAQTGLVLHTKLHLMYLVTPYDMVGSVNPIAATYFQAFNKLSIEELGVARTLGINETVMVKLMSSQTPKVDPFVLQRFYLTLMLNELYKGESFWNVSERYGCTRGDVQNLLANAASFASSVYHFVQELEQFWAFSELLLPFSRELSLCCSAEIIPLMELPSVGKGRAQLLYKAGFRSLADVSKSTVEELCSRVDHLPMRTARQMIAAAQNLVQNRIEVLRDEADFLMEMLPKRIPITQLNPDDTFRTQDCSLSLLDDSSLA